MSEENLDVFGRALLYMYQSNLENIGVAGALTAVRVEQPEEPDSRKQRRDAKEWAKSNFP